MAADAVTDSFQVPGSEVVTTSITHDGHRYCLKTNGGGADGNVPPSTMHNQQLVERRGGF
jgi:hypothetical protein